MSMTQKMSMIFENFRVKKREEQKRRREEERVR